MAGDNLDDAEGGGNWDEDLATVIDTLVDMSNDGEVSIADVDDIVEFATEGNIEKLLLAACIVLIGIGTVSERRGGRTSFELLEEMRKDLESMGGKWN